MAPSSLSYQETTPSVTCPRAHGESRSCGATRSTGRQLWPKDLVWRASNGQGRRVLRLRALGWAGTEVGSVDSDLDMEFPFPGGRVKSSTHMW